MRKVIKDPNSPTGWSLQQLGSVEHYHQWCREQGSRLDYMNHDKKSDLYVEQYCNRIPCSGFREGEEVEKWKMQLQSRTIADVWKNEDWATESELKSWKKETRTIAVPIKEVTEGEASPMLDALKVHLENTPKEELQKQWYEADISNSISPVASHSCTPEQKAAEFVETFHKTCSLTLAGAHSIFKQIAKQAASICVEEILKAIDWHDHETPNQELNYWQQVKEAITKL